MKSVNKMLVFKCSKACTIEGMDISAKRNKQINNLFNSTRKLNNNNVKRINLNSCPTDSGKLKPLCSKNPCSISTGSNANINHITKISKLSFLLIFGNYLF